MNLKSILGVTLQTFLLAVKCVIYLAGKLKVKLPNWFFVGLVWVPAGIIAILANILHVDKIYGDRD